MRSILRFVVLLGLATSLLTAPALAQQPDAYVDGEVTEVDPQTLVVDPADPADPGAQVLGVQQERSEGSALPVTGGDAVGLAVVAVVMIAGGAALVLLRRSRHDMPRA